MLAMFYWILVLVIKFDSMGSGQQYFTGDLPIGGHQFVQEIVKKNDISYTEAQDLLYKRGSPLW